jgi:predicted esterase
VAAVSVVLVALSGCGTDEVTMTEVSGEGTQQMQVWAPPGDGPWPVMYALPGSGGDVIRDLGTLAPELAARGVLVIGTDVRSDPFNATYIEADSECGYRHAMAIAEDHGADPSAPVTMLGFSLGATSALLVGLDGSLFGPGGRYDDCFTGVDRPDVVVALAGCNLQYKDFTQARADHTDTRVVLMSGATDTICPSSLHTGPMQEALEQEGFTVETADVPGADHGGLVFRNTVDWTELPPDDPAGQATVEAILQAIDDGQE